MSTAGVRQLRDGLSRDLGDVRAGRTVTVTDHGRPVARIVPVDAPNALERPIAEGKVRPSAAGKRSAPVPVPVPVQVAGSVSDLLPEQRR